MGEQLLQEALKALHSVLEETGREVNIKELEWMVTKHACAAAIAATTAGWIPGAGGAIVSGIGVGFVIAMYVRLGSALGVRLSRGLIRAIVSVIAAEIVANLTITIVGVTALSLFPGLGSIGASALSALANFAFVYIAAIIYVKMVSTMVQNNVSFENADEAQVKAAAAEALASTNMKEAIEEAKHGFKQAKKNGEMEKGAVTADLADDE